MPLGCRNSMHGPCVTRRSHVIISPWPPTGGLGKRHPVLHVKRNHFIDNLAQLGKYGLLIIAMTPAVEQSRTTADKTLVFVRPFDNLYVLTACIHCWASRMADLTAFSWYAFASPPPGRQESPASLPSDARSSDGCLGLTGRRIPQPHAL